MTAIPVDDAMAAGLGLSEAQPGGLRIGSFAGADLTADREQWLVDSLIAALPNLKMAQLFACRRDMFRDADLITVAVDDGRAVGTLTSAWATLPSGARFLHLLTQFVGERYQARRTHAFRLSWGDHFRNLVSTAADFPGLIALKTYNPIAYCAMRAFTRIPGVRIYPDPNLAVQDTRAQELATQVAAQVAAAVPFDPVTGVLHGAGRPVDLYPDLPVSSHPEVNDYFAAVTRPGDRVLAMLEVPFDEQAAAILRAFGLAATSTGGAT